jgi:hypothetical protein
MKDAVSNMKNRMILVAMLSILINANSQMYTTALGVRADASTLDVALAEISVKHFFSEKNAFEINFGAGRYFLWSQLLFHSNNRLKKDIEWYWGAGVDGGYWFTGSHGGGGKYDQNGAWLGLDGVLGIEYTFNYIPINLAMDMGPTFRVIPAYKLGWMLGFTIRYGFR